MVNKHIQCLALILKIKRFIIQGVCQNLGTESLTFSPLICSTQTLSQQFLLFLLYLSSSPLTLKPLQFTKSLIPTIYMHFSKNISLTLLTFI